MDEGERQIKIKKLTTNHALAGADIPEHDWFARIMICAIHIHRRNVLKTPKKMLKKNCADYILITYRLHFVNRNLTDSLSYHASLHYK
jgi:hypothetical protein